MSIQESRSTSKLLTQRWTKFGKDRLYVKTDDGLDVGWLDLVDGSRLVTKPQFAEAFNLTLESWLASRSQGCTSTLSNAVALDSAHVEELGIVEKPSVPRLADRAQRAEQPWEDLALRVAGQAATEQAEAPQNVSVLTHSSVCAWLSARPRCLGRDVVDAIYEMARRSTTWSG